MKPLNPSRNSGDILTTVLTQLPLMPLIFLFNELKGAQNIALWCLFSSLNRNRKKKKKKGFAHWSILKMLLYTICQYTQTQVNCGLETLTSA